VRNLSRKGWVAPLKSISACASKNVSLPCPPCQVASSGLEVSAGRVARVGRLSATEEVLWRSSPRQVRQFASN
jgi:hypothetical protein